MTHCKRKRTRASFLQAAFGATAAVTTTFAPSIAMAQTQLADLSTMSLEQLMNVQVSTATLTKTKSSAQPATVTTITAEDIKASGARDLRSLLEIYVPGLTVVKHAYEVQHIGIRGVISDRDNKQLIVLNGKVLNNLTHAGAITEFDQVNLGDIKEISVVRGPGSVVYGAGAVSGVINITTFDATSAPEGSVTSAHIGSRDEYYALETSNAHTFKDGSGLYLFAGIANQVGANARNAEYIPGISGTRVDGSIGNGGDPLRDVPMMNNEVLNRPPLKLHLEYTNQDFMAWTRYTRGGDSMEVEPRNTVLTPGGFSGIVATNPGQQLPTYEIAYEQVSSGTSYVQHINEALSVKYTLGFDDSSYERYLGDQTPDLSQREEKYTANITTKYKVSEDHELAIGTEYTRGEYGLPALHSGTADGSASIFNFANNNLPTPQWSTDTYSVFGESQYHLTDMTTSFLGLRWDKSSFTNSMYSPRAALVIQPTDKDTFKLIASEAMKMNFQEELKYGMDTSGIHETKPERLRSYEAAYSRELSTNSTATITSFYNQLRLTGVEVISNTTEQHYRTLGNQSFIGSELEYQYRKDRWNFGISHAFAKQVNFSDAVDGQSVSAKPYGFGNEANFFADNISKAQVRYAITDKLSASTSTQVLWGWKGYEDYTNWQNSLDDAVVGYAPGKRDPNYNPYNDIQIRLNMGLSYQVDKDFSVGLFGYNLGGLWDKDNNKRFIMFSSGSREDPISYRLTLEYKL